MFIAASIFLAIFAWIILYITVKPWKKLPEEQGKTPILESTWASGMVGGLYSRGLIRLSVYTDFIVVTSPFTSLLLYWNEIENAEIKPYYFYKALYIYYRKKGVAHTIMVATELDEKILGLIDKHAKIK